MICSVRNCQKAEHRCGVSRPASHPCIGYFYFNSFLFTQWPFAYSSSTLLSYDPSTVVGHKPRGVRRLDCSPRSSHPACRGGASAILSRPSRLLGAERRRGGRGGVRASARGGGGFAGAARPGEHRPRLQPPAVLPRSLGGRDDGVLDGAGGEGFAPIAVARRRRRFSASH